MASPLREKEAKVRTSIDRKATWRSWPARMALGKPRREPCAPGQGWNSGELAGAS